MDDEKEIQKELFEFEERPKRPKRFSRLFTRLFPKPSFENRLAVTLPFERLIFFAIVIIMVMVIVYALGVERGKTLNKSKVVVPNQPQPVTVKAVLDKVTIVAPSKTEVVKETSAKPYTIVAVTLSRKDLAEQEANRLKRLELEAFVYQSDSYFQVCVGAYVDKDSALSKKALGKVRQLYKDAYFRLQ